MPPQVSQSAQRPQAPSTGELIDRLSRFDGPPELFLVNLVAVQCHIAPATGGAILRAGGQEGQPEVLAVYPPLAEGATVPVWLAMAVESSREVVESGETTVKPLHGPDDMYGAAAKKYVAMVPLRGGQGVRGLTAFVMEPPNQTILRQSVERLEITASLLSLYEMRLTLQRRQLDLRRLRVAMECLSSVNDQAKFAGAAMALCNEIASRWQADRVSLGFLKGRYVHLKAMSHTEKFSRKMKLVQDIEASMEECLDQDVEIVYPSSPQDTFVSRATADLSKRHGPSAVLSLPLRRDGEVRAVITIERPLDKPFDLDEAESLRLTGELSTARLVSMYESDRWFGARIAATARKGLAFAVGAKHTWAKIAAIVVFGLALFLVFAKGTYKVEAPFVVQAVDRRVVPAAFDGFLDEVLVEPNQRVRAGDVLGRLKTEDLRLQLVRARSEYSAKITQASQSEAKGERAEALVAKREAEGIEAQIHELEWMIEQADLRAPFDGVVLVGDLDQQIDAPVKKGDVLFEVAPLTILRAELSVTEDQIPDVIQAWNQARQSGGEVTGELATEGKPDERIDFIVERVNPVAEVADQRNVYKVRVRLEDVDLASRHTWLRPGMEGVSKIDLDKRHYAWIWSRRLVNWLRMKLWV